MTNYHFISIFIISCILLGIQPSVSAQSSDRVYSPYAQYLTNDTTIPPPVGELADAALSCFRYDTVYVLIMPTGQLYIWLRPDPLLDKYIHLSPYVYCNGNPLKYVDPDGEDWYEDGGEIKWTDCKSQQAMDKVKLSGIYLGEAAVIFNGNANESWGTDNTLTGEYSNPASVTIYGVNGKDDIKYYRGMTTPQSDFYSTLNAGEYKMFYQDMATSVYGEKGALAHNPPIAPALTYRITKPNGNAILDGTKKGVATTMTEIFMHRTNWDGTANHSSKGCMIIDGRQWRDVEKQLKRSSNIYLRIIRW